MIWEITIKIGEKFYHFVAELLEKLWRKKSGDAVACIDDEFEFFCGFYTRSDVVQIIILEIGGRKIAFVDGNIKILFLNEFENFL